MTRQDDSFCLYGDRDGRHLTLPLRPGAQCLGSARDCDLRLDQRGVSRRHARLTVGPGGVELEDLESKNGTRVNGRRIRAATLEPGDEIRLGETRLVLARLDPRDAELAIELDDAGSLTSTGLEATEETPLLGRDDAAPPLRFPPGIVPGRSPAMRELYRQMAPLAASDLPVLITGETGVGKEHLALTLHGSSRRAGGPFVALNCATIPAELLEAELFGIAKGVATGVDARVGQLDRADGGTVFLDEIGDMPADLQVKLLRVLQDKVVQPLGAEPRRVDVRIVAATHARLAARIAAGAFRQDLYYRLAGAVLEVPALRDRREDVPLLVGHFLERFRAESGRAVRGVTVKALRALTRYDWPGNVRELEHEVRRLVYVCGDGQAIDSRALSPKLVDAATDVDDEHDEHDERSLAERLEALERRLIVAALERTGGNQSETARRLRISRNGLAKRLKRLRIDPRDFQG